MRRTLLAACLALAPGTLAAQLPAVVTESPLDARQGVNFHALVRPETVYVGQQANYQVGVFLDDDVRGRLRRNPEFVPPEMTGMLAYELPVTHGTVPKGERGRYEVHVFERAVFPLLAGVHDVPPARLSYSLPLSRSFFSREESYTLRSERVRVVALAPPVEGRPTDYEGAVASALALDARVRDDSAARVGDPLLLTVRISGRGNVNLFPRPRLSLSWAQAVPADERVTLDSSSRVVSGSKEFDWLVTPRQAGRLVVPPIRYPYFDPYAERYVLAVTRPAELQVAAGTLATLDAAPTLAPLLSVRRAYHGETRLPPSRQPLYWWMAALMPLPLLGVRLRRRPPRTARAPSPAQRLQAITAQPAGTDARTVRAAFVSALAGRLPARTMLGERGAVLVRLLRREGVSAEVALEVAELLQALDAMVYSADRHFDPQLVERASAAYAHVDAEARRGGVYATRTTAIVALIVATALAGAHARAAAPATAPTAAELFAGGVRSYDARRFGDAVELFAATARRAPRAPDAWANLGTAAWAGGDTARAVLGWQRAIRLQPTAADLKSRLRLAPSGQLSGFAAVPPVAPAWLDWLALAVWGATWGVATWRLWRRQRGVASIAWLGGAVAVLVGTGALVARERAAGERLAIVRAPLVVRTTPALAADATHALQTGSLVRTERVNGLWTRVDTRAGSGWVATQDLLPLHSP